MSTQSIVPLPVFEADADPALRTGLTDEEIYDNLKSPDTIVVKFGVMGLVGEFVYGGDAKPGCGSKLVARTHRGTELVEMLTTTCTNSGCGKSVTRKELLEYIDQSGGRDYPFSRNGRVLRIATIEDMNEHSALEAEKPGHLKRCRQLVAEAGLDMKVIDAEPILGRELLTFYYTAEDRVDFRELVRGLAAELKTRIEMRQVGARDEARITADYERCGQYCCCKNFLKVLKPISIRSAKVQKATLDPLKISGRCGRLMCCLRYEDETYAELKKKLPHRKSRVGTAEGPGLVIDSKILVQLVLVRLEHDGREIAVPVEELMDPDACPEPGSLVEPEEERELDPLRGMDPSKAKAKSRDGSTPPERRARRQRGKNKGSGGAKPRKGDADAAAKDPDAPRKSRRRRRKPKSKGAGPAQGQGQSGPQSPTGDAPKPDGAAPKKRRRRRRRRGGGAGDGGNPGGGGGGE